MEYPARFVKDKNSGGFVITFPDVAEAITEADSMDEAIPMAEEALELALTFYTEASKDLPVPRPLKKGMRMVRVPALSEAKFMLYSALRSAGIRKVELARRLGCWPSQVDPASWTFGTDQNSINWKARSPQSGNGYPFNCVTWLPRS